METVWYKKSNPDTLIGPTVGSNGISAGGISQGAMPTVQTAPFMPSANASTVQPQQVASVAAASTGQISTGAANPNAPAQKSALFRHNQGLQMHNLCFYFC